MKRHAAADFVSANTEAGTAGHPAPTLVAEPQGKPPT